MDEADTTDQVHDVIIESAIANYCPDYIGLIPGAVPHGAMPCILTLSHPTTDPRCSEELGLDLYCAQGKSQQPKNGGSNTDTNTDPYPDVPAPYPDVPAPTGASIVSKWVGDLGHRNRYWEAPPRVVGVGPLRNRPNVQVCGVQFVDSTIDAHVAVDRGRPDITPAQARQLARALIAAAAEVEDMGVNRPR
jgi:hypothetical protein